jgi:hypothetical protein
MNELKTLGKIGIWIGIAATAYLGMLGGIGGAQYAVLARPELLVALSAFPLILASHIWRRPELVSILAVGLSIPAVSGIMTSNSGVPNLPFAAVMIAIDFLAIRYSFRKQEVENRTLDLEAIGDIVRLVGNGAAYGLIADRLNECSQHFIGEGRTRFWLVDPSQGEINLIPTGEAAVMARLPGQSKYSGTRLNYPLDSTLASAKAATTGEVVDVADLLVSGPELLMSRQQAEFDGYRTILALPLFSRGRVAGVLSFETAQKGQRYFSKPERLNLRTLAALATLALNDVANRDQ